VYTGLFMKEYAVAIDLGGTRLKGGIVSSDGDITHYRIISSEIERGPEKIMNNLTSVIADLLENAGIEKKTIKGIGVATPGIIDPVFGGLTGGAENLPGWKNTPFMRILPMLRRPCSGSIPSGREREKKISCLHRSVLA